MIRISICDSLYKRNKETSLLKQVVTGNEKWIIYNYILHITYYIFIMSSYQTARW